MSNKKEEKKPVSYGLGLYWTKDKKIADMYKGKKNDKAR